MIVNCTGLAARKLQGVADKAMYPIRGQTVLVRNEPNQILTTCGCDEADDETCYIMQRALGGGTVLGGCYQVGSWNAEVDHDLAQRIMKRAVDACSALTTEKALPEGSELEPHMGVDSLSVMRHAVGLRPAREGGTRLESEKIGGTWVVHNYGHGGYGYQSSYGCSQEVLELVKQIV